MDSHGPFVDLYEEEHDAFYHELKRQVLLLMTEEEEEKTSQEGPGARKQENGPCSVNGTIFYYYDWPEIKKDSDGMRTSMSGLWRSGNGTGVFIPQVERPKKIYSSRIKVRRKTYRPVKTN